MIPGRRSRDPAARGTRHEACSHEVGLADLFQSRAFLSDSNGDAPEPDRTSAVDLHEGSQNGPVQLVQADCIDFVHSQRGISQFQCDPTIALDLGVISHAAKKAIGNARCST